MAGSATFTTELSIVTTAGPRVAVIRGSVCRRVIGAVRRGPRLASGERAECRRRFLGFDLPGPQERAGDGEAEDEAADVGEERDAAARAGAEQPEVRLEELVQEPEPEEE